MLDVRECRTLSDGLLSGSLIALAFCSAYAEDIVQERRRDTDAGAGKSVRSTQTLKLAQRSSRAQAECRRHSIHAISTIL